MKLQLLDGLNDEVWLRITTDKNSNYHFRLNCVQGQIQNMCNAFGKVFEEREGVKYNCVSCKPFEKKPH